MKVKARKLWGMISMALIAVMSCPMITMAAEEAEEYVPAMYASFWALIPSVVAIL